MKSKEKKHTSYKRPPVPRKRVVVEGPSERERIPARLDPIEVRRSEFGAGISQASTTRLVEPSDERREETAAANFEKIKEPSRLNCGFSSSTDHTEGRNSTSQLYTAHHDGSHKKVLVLLILVFPAGWRPSPPPAPPVLLFFVQVPPTHVGRHVLYLCVRESSGSYYPQPT